MTKPKDINEKMQLIKEFASPTSAAAEMVEEIDRLRESLAEIREVWAGSECGEPVYSQEAYAIRLCKQMYQMACEALK